MKNIQTDKKKENTKVGPRIKISEKNPREGGTLILKLTNKKHQKVKKGTLKIKLFPKKILRDL